MATVAADRAEHASVLAAPRLLGHMLEAAWAKGLLPEPVLDPHVLVDEAMRVERGALDDGSWRDGLQLLTGELQSNAALNPLGRVIAHGLILGTLRQRIRAWKLWSKHPEISGVAVDAPVIVLGHMRSGTTRLHRLLACDPRFSYTRLHETLNPVPQSRAGSIGSAFAVRGLLNLCNPHLRSIHPTSPTTAEEEFGLHAFSFHGAMFEAQWRVPAFARWCEQRPLSEVYFEFRRLLQTLRWARGEPAARIQILKTPQFMQDLPEVLQTFPDARLLLIERDRSEVVASSASLVWNQQKVQSDCADPRWAGREWARKTGLRQSIAHSALAAQRNVPLLRIDYAAMNLDWRAQMERVYRFLGEPLSAATARRMARVAASPRHRGHSYDPERFGLGRDRELISSDFPSPARMEEIIDAPRRRA